MLKQVTKLEALVGEKVAHLYLDNDTPIGVVKEMLYQFVAYVAQVEANVKAQMDAEAAQKAEAVVQPEIVQGDLPVTDEVKPADCTACY